jgi:high affinity Mn2+ porin
MPPSPKLPLPKFTKLAVLTGMMGLSGWACAELPKIDSPQVLADSPERNDPPVRAYGPLPALGETWTMHGQATYVVQQKNNFASPTSGRNSLLNKAEGGGTASYTLSMTAFLGARLWEGAEVYYNPELFQGTPFNGELVGLGGFQNGELQKGAFTKPVHYTARAFVRQTFNLGDAQQTVHSGANQLAGHVDENRLVFSFGKLATLDFFDFNTYSHDTRTQFQNFSLFSMGAYSYAADTKGFTYGGVMEWYHKDWIVKAARLALPTVPNTQTLDFTLKKDFTDQIEVTHQHELWSQPGAVRALYYQQFAFMGNYSNALAQAQPTPDISSVRQAAQRAWGYGLNMEQAIGHEIGIFARWSWNPGRTETQTVDISQSLSGGVTLKGVNGSRPHDSVGFGFAMNGLAASQISYLQKGGLSPFIGDGSLNYKNEKIWECYYSAKVYQDLHLTLDYQRIANPAYNASRGPVHFLGLRAHIEI